MLKVLLHNYCHKQSEHFRQQQQKNAQQTISKLWVLCWCGIFDVKRAVEVEEIHSVGRVTSTSLWKDWPRTPGLFKRPENTWQPDVAPRITWQPDVAPKITWQPDLAPKNTWQPDVAPSCFMSRGQCELYWLDARDKSKLYYGKFDLYRIDTMVSLTFAG